MNKRKVTFLNRVYPPQRGATGRVLRDLARAMEKDGWDVTVICAAETGGEEYDGKIRVVRVKAPVRKQSVAAYFKAWYKMMRCARKMERPDLLVTMTDPPLVVVAGDMIARKHKCSHIHWCHDLFPDVMPALGLRVPDTIMSFLTKMGRRAMRNCDRVIAVGRCMAKYISHHGVEKSKISVVTNWPDHELLYIDEDADKKKSEVKDQKRKSKKEETKAISPKLRKRYRPFEDQKKDNSERRFRVLYSGNLGRAHPVKTILEAASLLNETYPDVEFMFVGDGEVYDKLAEERAKRELNNVKLLPWQPVEKLREVMESGDLHLVTMQQEASGMLVPCKFYSALAVGRPCVFIGPEDSEVAQVLKDFQAGIVVPQGDAERLVSVIKTFRENSDDWFTAHEGAVEAGQVFVPEHSIQAWIKRAETVLEDAHEKEFAA